MKRLLHHKHNHYHILAIIFFTVMASLVLASTSFTKPVVEIFIQASVTGNVITGMPVAEGSYISITPANELTQKEKQEVSDQIDAVNIANRIAEDVSRTKTYATTTVDESYNEMIIDFGEPAETSQEQQTEEQTSQEGLMQKAWNWMRELFGGNKFNLPSDFNDLPKDVQKQIQKALKDDKNIGGVIKFDAQKETASLYAGEGNGLLLSLANVPGECAEGCQLEVTYKDGTTASMPSKVSASSSSITEALPPNKKVEDMSSISLVMPADRSGVNNLLSTTLLTPVGAIDRQNNALTTNTESVCGNGVIEQGEECEKPGKSYNINIPEFGNVLAYCNPETCRLNYCEEKPGGIGVFYKNRAMDQPRSLNNDLEYNTCYKCSEKQIPLLSKPEIDVRGFPSPSDDSASPSPSSSEQRRLDQISSQYATSKNIKTTRCDLFCCIIYDSATKKILAKSVKYDKNQCGLLAPRSSSEKINTEIVSMIATGLGEEEFKKGCIKKIGICGDNIVSSDEECDPPGVMCPNNPIFGSQGPGIQCNNKCRCQEIEMVPPITPIPSPTEATPSFLPPTGIIIDEFGTKSIKSPLPSKFILKLPLKGLDELKLGKTKIPKEKLNKDLIICLTTWPNEDDEIINRPIKKTSSTKLTANAVKLTGMQIADKPTVGDSVQAGEGQLDKCKAKGSKKLFQGYSAMKEGESIPDEYNIRTWLDADCYKFCQPDCYPVVQEVNIIKDRDSISGTAICSCQKSPSQPTQRAQPLDELELPGPEEQPAMPPCDITIPESDVKPADKIQATPKKITPEDANRRVPVPEDLWLPQTTFPVIPQLFEPTEEQQDECKIIDEAWLGTTPAYSAPNKISAEEIMFGGAIITGQATSDNPKCAQIEQKLREIRAGLKAGKQSYQEAVEGFNTARDALLASQNQGRSDAEISIIRDQIIQEIQKIKSIERNFNELASQVDPTAREFDSLGCNRDRDKDGVSDLEEILRGGDPDRAEEQPPTQCCVCINNGEKVGQQFRAVLSGASSDADKLQASSSAGNYISREDIANMPDSTPAVADMFGGNVAASCQQRCQGITGKDQSFVLTQKGLNCAKYFAKPIPKCMSVVQREQPPQMPPTDTSRQCPPSSCESKASKQISYIYDTRNPKSEQDPPESADEVKYELRKRCEDYCGRGCTSSASIDSNTIPPITPSKWRTLASGEIIINARAECRCSLSQDEQNQRCPPGQTRTTRSAGRSVIQKCGDNCKWIEETPDITRTPPKPVDNWRPPEATTPPLTFTPTTPTDTSRPPAGCPEGTVQEGDKCIKCPPGTMYQGNGRCGCGEGQSYVNNECTSDCTKVCGSTGLTTKQPDYNSFILAQLSRERCVTSANIIIPGKTIAGTCSCYNPSRQPQITIDRTRPFCKNTPCGDIPCDSGRSCGCGARCTITISCNWGGWKDLGNYEYMPIIGSASSSPTTAPETGSSAPTADAPCPSGTYRLQAGGMCIQEQLTYLTGDESSGPIASNSGSGSNSDTGTGSQGGEVLPG